MKVLQAVDGGKSMGPVMGLRGLAGARGAPGDAISGAMGLANVIDNRGVAKLLQVTHFLDAQHFVLLSDSHRLLCDCFMIYDYP